jgi:aerobic-type carbon monoxide dehydrogenase small subunit (CoxS/CutS family)
MEVNLTVNGKEMNLEVAPNEILSDTLRRYGFHGVKIGCRTGDCGTCTVIIEGEAINCCLMLSGQAEGKNITTIESMASGATLHPLQVNFLEVGAVQCGFCIPGMILSAKVLLDDNQSPTREEVEKCLSGNLCRCTGYEKPVQAILLTAEQMRGESNG